MTFQPGLDLLAYQVSPWPSDCPQVSLSLRQLSPNIPSSQSIFPGWAGWEGNIVREAGGRASGIEAVKYWYVALEAPAVKKSVLQIWSLRVGKHGVGRLLNVFSRVLCCV
jgi:hypothetical protein